MNIPLHLNGKKAAHEQAGEPIAQFEIGDYQNFVYLILDWNTKKAGIVDPQLDLSGPRDCLKRHSFELVSILLTHTHFDHIAGVPQLIQSYPDVPVCVHSKDSHRLNKKILETGKLKLLNDEEWISIGELRIQAIHTPGHSAGEISYFIKNNPPYLFTGDTVFIRDCGRTDFETGSNAEMFHSLQRIRSLPPESIILPGHHYREECASTLEKELRESPPFQCKSVEELASLP